MTKVTLKFGVFVFISLLFCFPIFHLGLHNVFLTLYSFLSVSSHTFLLFSISIFMLFFFSLLIPFHLCLLMFLLFSISVFLILSHSLLFSICIFLLLFAIFHLYLPVVFFSLLIPFHPYLLMPFCYFPSLSSCCFFFHS